jgi:hypothetical protein
MIRLYHMLTTLLWRHAAPLPALLPVRARVGRKASVSVLFATSFVTLLMMVGLAVDYSFYNEAETQLGLAADSAAMHAVRIAVQAVQQQQSNYAAQGQAAGSAWFYAQAGSVPQLKLLNPPSVQVYFNTSNNLLTATVSYTGVVVTHFGALFPGHWQNWPNWGIAGNATAVISAETYIEFDFLADNSSSMLIASTAAGIAAMDNLTPCSTQSATAYQTIDSAYSWVYNPTTLYGGPNNNSSQRPANAQSSTTYIPYGYGVFSYSNTSRGTTNVNEVLPTTSPQVGSCDPNFTGPTSGTGNQCPYVPAKNNIIHTNGYGQCANANNVPTGGGPGNYVDSHGALQTNGTNVPQAPCAFACHYAAVANGQTYSNDYYGLARQNNVQLRFDVVQSSMETVIQSLINFLPNSPVPAPFKVGVYSFNSTFGSIYTPPNSVTTASAETAELNAALAAVTNYTTPVVANSADTNFPLAMTSLQSILTAAGNGSTAGTARKNLFIVTDGMQDYIDGNGNRQESAIDPSQCTAIKNLGFTIYVLYTQYQPLPNNYYLGTIKQYAEPAGSSAISTALQACATSSATYFQASSATDIANAMQQMLVIALRSAGRLSG